MDIDQDELQSLYEWVDDIPLSRPKRNIARDFSDGVLVAEMVKSFHPRLVDLHNYSGASGLAQKLYNWSTLNAKVFRKLGFVVRHPECEAVASAQPGAVERVLKLLRLRLEEYGELHPPTGSRPSSPTHSRGVQADVGYASEGYAGGENERPDSAALPWGEQAALLHIEEQECTIADLTTTNEALEEQAGMLKAALKDREDRLAALTARLADVEGKMKDMTMKMRNCNIIRPARPLAERTPNSMQAAVAPARRSKPPAGLARLDFDAAARTSRS